jgi:hypothetical protein
LLRAPSTKGVTPSKDGTGQGSASKRAEHESACNTSTALVDRIEPRDACKGPQWAPEKKVGEDARVRIEQQLGAFANE